MGNLNVAMNAAIMLTDKQIRDAKPRTTVYRLRDTQSVCRGFGVVVAPSGSKSFFLSFTSPEDGKRKQVSLGRYPSTKLADARRLALEYLGKVDNGIDQQCVGYWVERRNGRTAVLHKGKNPNEINHE